MELSEYLLTVLIMSLVCVGLYTAINLFLVALIDEDTNSISQGLPRSLRFFAKPILTCVNCYASIYGTIVFYYLHGLEYEILGYWAFACLSCAYLNGLLRNVYNRFE